MFYSNKILMPFKETEQFPSSILEVTKNYYEQLGYEVILGGEIDEGHNIFLRSKSRNMLVSESDSDIVILIDADALVMPQAIEQAISICSENDAVIRLGSRTTHVSLELSKDISNIILNNEVFPDDMFNYCVNKNLHPGSSWVMNRKVWDIIGGFNESFIWHGFEDLEFNLRASRISKLLFLEFDEFITNNLRKININSDINKQIYQTSHILFYEDEKNSLSIRRGDAESELSVDVVRSLLKYENYAM